MFVSLHRLNEEGHQRFETLAADPVRRLPDHNQRIADCLIIKSARGPWSAPCGLFAAQHPHGVLAMKTGHSHELIQDAGFLATLAISVSLSYRYHQFVSRRHGDPPHPRLRSRISVGSKLDEATAQYPGAFLARQCVGHRNCRSTLDERNIDWHTLYGVKQEDLVPSGVAELARLQLMGFQYIHP